MLIEPPNPYAMRHMEGKYQAARDRNGEENGEISARYACRYMVRGGEYEFLCIRIIRIHNSWLQQTGGRGCAWDDKISPDVDGWTGEQQYNALLRVCGAGIARLLWLAGELTDADEVKKIRRNLRENATNDERLLEIAQKTLANPPKK